MQHTLESGSGRKLQTRSYWPPYSLPSLGPAFKDPEQLFLRVLEPRLLLQKPGFKDAENKLLEEFCLQEAEQNVKMAVNSAVAAAGAAPAASSSGSGHYHSYPSTRRPIPTTSGSGRGSPPGSRSEQPPAPASSSTSPERSLSCSRNCGAVEEPPVAAGGAGCSSPAAAVVEDINRSINASLHSAVLPKYRSALQFFQTSLKYRVNNRESGATRRRICEVVLQAADWACENQKEPAGVELLQENYALAQEVDEAEASVWLSRLRHAQGRVRERPGGNGISREVRSGYAAYGRSTPLRWRMALAMASARPGR